MNPRTKILLAIVALFFILTAFRESGLVSFSWNSIATQNMVSTQWADVVLKNDSLAARNSANINANDVSVIVIADADTLFKELKATEPVIVKITSQNVGSLWMPLYKSANYTTVATVAGNHSNGTLTAMGHITVKGFSSAKQAREAVNNTVVGSLVAETRRHYMELNK